MTNDLAIKILNGDVLGTNEQTHEAVAMAVKALSVLPSTQLLTAYVISDEDGNIKCSNCGSFECWGNYCMNCGAKMGR